MGRRSITGGVTPKGSDRIQFDFELDGVRYRPTLKRLPNEANLRRARKQLEEIKARIANGTFCFAEEFPEYRDRDGVIDAGKRRMCNNLFDEFIKRCESRTAKNDLAFAIHRDWGEAQGNNDEFRFFTGLRPSEQIALRITDCDLVHGKISVTKARVMARDKDRTKTSEDRLVELCPRALQVLKGHLALRAELKLQGKIDHDDLFFKEDGTPIRNLQYPWVRWKRTLQRMKVRYREPYNARHSSVSWNLMIGKNPLWLAKQHGHSVQTMLEVYAAWTEGAKEADIEAIKQAMQSPPRVPARIEKPTALVALRAPEFRTDLALEGGGVTVSDGNQKENTGGERGIRTRLEDEPDQ